MVLLALFAGVALVLATIGIAGVMAYIVTQGTRDLGIRLALGAMPGAILAMVLRQGLTLAVLGIGLGLTAAIALAGVVDSLLFQVGARDPATFVTIAAGLLLVALVATLIPAHRASRIDPLISLRHE
jgi:ABC-type antimicrobial peptide transport system permease subunit